MQHLHPKFREFINKKMTVADMPNADFKMIAENLGVDYAVKLLELMGGMWLSVPKTWSSNIAIKYVKEHYNGENTRQLVHETGFGMSKIYKILNEKMIEQNQLTLNDITGD